MAESLLLFFVGRRQQVPNLVWAANTLIVLTLGALLWDWFDFYAVSVAEVRPFLHPVMMTTLLCAAGMVAILVLNRLYPAALTPEKGAGWYAWGIPLLVLLVLHSGIWLEITRYGDDLLLATREVVLQPDGTESLIQDPALEPMILMWRHCFSLAFVAMATWLVLTRFWQETLSVVIGLCGIIALLTFFSEGLYLMETLRKTFFQPAQPTVFPPHPGLIGIRYLALALAATLMYMGAQTWYRQIHEGVSQRDVKIVLEVAIFLAGLILTSNELIFWMLNAGSTQPGKLGLTLFWTLYSLGVIAWGLRYHNKPLRIASICLIGFSLLKLMVYDLAHLSALSRTVILVCVGIVLLVTSFLYNKLRHVLEAESDEPE
jgi:uncharacterized membrane protein